MGQQKKIVVYTTTYCPYCEAAKRLLGQKGVKFEEINVEDRPDLRDEIAKKSGQETVPQVFVDGKPIGGYSDIKKLDDEGKLDQILNL